MSTDIHRLFSARRQEYTDINEHLDTLRELAMGCRTVCEFGVRSGHSTTALLCGLAEGLATNPQLGPVELHSFDIAHQQFHPPALPEGVSWHFTRADTTELQDIPLCDGLFIDTLHNASVVEAELRHAGRVRYWIAFHDTVLFGSRDEAGPGPGINHAIFRFMSSLQGRRWYVASHAPNNNGLLVLRRAGRAFTP